MGEFVIKDIELTLTPSSINQAIREINKFNKDLKAALDKLVEHLLTLGVNIARMKLKSYIDSSGRNSGDLAASIRVEMANGQSGEGYLCAGYPGDAGEGSQYSYAVYFEFGFGTGSYYTKQSLGGNLIKNQNSLERHFDAGTIDASRTSGRNKAHPSGRDVYRKMEDYNIMKTPNNGEFFGWVYKDKDGNFYVSHGQNPKPFMYDTLMWLTKEAQFSGAGRVVQYIAGRGT